MPRPRDGGPAGGRQLLSSAGRATAAAAALAAAPFALLPPTLDAGDVALFPDASVRLLGSYYVPPEDAFVWDTWIGAGAGVLRVKAATAYLTADVETVLGRERRAFDANQVGYHLETGLRVRAGRHLVIPFFEHVSRHLVDRPKTQLVDWNVLGVCLAGRLPTALPVRGRYSASVGHTVEWRAVGYDWEAEGALDLELVRRRWGGSYVAAEVRLVSVDSRSLFPRGSFVDLLVEVGVRHAAGGRSLDVFVAYEHRNDVYVLAPGVRDRALLGLRFAFSPTDGEGPDLPVRRLGRP